MTTAVNEKLEAQVARYRSCDNYQENQSANARKEQCQVGIKTMISGATIVPPTIATPCCKPEMIVCPTVDARRA
jgi:hypothetical protein